MSRREELDYDWLHRLTEEKLYNSATAGTATVATHTLNPIGNLEEKGKLSAAIIFDGRSAIPDHVS